MNSSPSFFSSAITLEQFLEKKQASVSLRMLFYKIIKAVKRIRTRILEEGQLQKTLNRHNVHGDQQIKLDLLAEYIIQEEMENSGLVKACVSEELSEPKFFEGKERDYIVAYDPIDGSSLVKSQGCFGSLFGIWKTSALLKNNGSDQIAACYVVYGSKMAFCLALPGKGTHHFEFNRNEAGDGEFFLTKENIILTPESRFFSPGNLRAVIHNPRYFEVIKHCAFQQKILRYSGCLVNELHVMLSYGQGVFMYPSDQQNPQGKLRLIVECAPCALIVREAGGASFDEAATPILEKSFNSYHATSSFFSGSKGSLKTVLKQLIDN